MDANQQLLLTTRFKIVERWRGWGLPKNTKIPTVPVLYTILLLNLYYQYTTILKKKKNMCQTHVTRLPTTQSFWLAPSSRISQIDQKFALQNLVQNILPITRAVTHTVQTKKSQTYTHTHKVKDLVTVLNIKLEGYLYSIVKTMAKIWHGSGKVCIDPEKGE